VPRRLEEPPDSRHLQEHRRRGRLGVSASYPVMVHAPCRKSTTCFMLGPTICCMTRWEVIEEALRHKKQKPQWLADRLGVSAQVVANWKARGVPVARYRAIADALGLTLDQLEGLAPPPWQKETGWPFPDIDQDRFNRLTEMQRGEIQTRVRDMIAEFEARSGKSSPSQSGAGRSAA
jgi:hypothetical protein